MAQDIAPAQIVCSGSTDGTAGGTTVTRGCVLTRVSAGLYDVAFNAVPPGPDVPAAHECMVFCNPIGNDPATKSLIVTKTLDGVGPGIKGFEAAATGSADTAFDWIVWRPLDGT